MEKYNKIQLTKNKIDLNIRKMTNHPPSPVVGRISPTNLTNHKSSFITIESAKHIICFGHLLFTQTPTEWSTAVHSLQHDLTENEKRLSTV